MKSYINIAVIGLGQRGSGLLQNVLVHQDDVEIVALCDAYQDRVDDGVKVVQEKKGNNPFATTDYKQVFEIDGLDAVLVSTSWEDHMEVTLYAMKKGIAVAMEVGGTYSVEELWEMVRTWEETRTPFMFMENCCFDRTELLATSMARKGMFGEIVHAQGAYGHDLREEIAGGNINRHYRLRNYMKRNCENYPTHEIGPIAKILDINRGNRFTSLVSVASKAVGLKDYVSKNKERYEELLNVDFKQGDIVTTIITCANGETVTLKLDTTLPRFYTRDFTIRGTKGFYEQNTNTVFLEEKEKEGEEFWNAVDSYKKMIDNGVQYEQEFLPDFWKNLTVEQRESGHGGMDYFEFRSFIDALKAGVEPCIDVYDAATWMAVSVLSEQSILQGGSAVPFPDFTCGKWLMRERKDVCIF
ncbi:MAG: Gfo/Idh/MocA family oxidoreductase [Tyzzerella sp.]|nr:Gfo/Idh/MocA family oxidoreductase [Tyzzerella sp.]